MSTLRTLRAEHDTAGDVVPENLFTDVQRAEVSSTLPEFETTRIARSTSAWAESGSPSPAKVRALRRWA